MTPESTPKVSQESFTLMPWLNFTRLTDAELHAIYSAQASNAVLTAATLH
jgi:hypothetical protein